jgi:dihydrodipicolinate reductase
LTLSHKAHSRMAFARGVPPAVLFVSGAAPGFYTMEDVFE